MQHCVFAECEAFQPVAVHLRRRHQCEQGAAQMFAADASGGSKRNKKEDGIAESGIFLLSDCGGQRLKDFFCTFVRFRRRRGNRENLLAGGDDAFIQRRIFSRTSTTVSQSPEPIRYYVKISSVPA